MLPKKKPSTLSFKKEIKKVERNLNKPFRPFEKNPRTWNHHQRVVVIGVSIIIFSLYSKIQNLLHWGSINFDMSSYPPEIATTYMISSILALLYGYMKKDKILEIVGLIGLGYTLIFLWGIFLTYYIN